MNMDLITLTYTSVALLGLVYFLIILSGSSGEKIAKEPKKIELVGRLRIRKDCMRTKEKESMCFRKGKEFG